MPYINQEEFEEMRQRFEQFDQKREEVIKGTISWTNIKLTQAEALAKVLLAKHGALSSALEEYAEAKSFLHFLQDRRLITLKELGICNEAEYLGGVVDLTGELGRLAVIRATARLRSRDAAAVREIYALTEELFGALTQFDFRNGALRKKFDSVKWNLKKLESILYDLSLAQGGRVSTADMDEQEPKRQKLDDEEGAE